MYSWTHRVRYIVLIYLTCINIKFSLLQVTEETCQILQCFGYYFEQRGLVAVKGKGQLMTYYLQGKRDSVTGEPEKSMVRKIIYIILFHWCIPIAFATKKEQRSFDFDVYSQVITNNNGLTYIIYLRGRRRRDCSFIKIF